MTILEKVQSMIDAFDQVSGATSANLTEAVNNYKLLYDAVIHSAGEYQRLEYIEGTGPQYINTGINLNSSTHKVTFTFSLVSKNNADFKFFGSCNNNSPYLVRTYSGYFDFVTAWSAGTYKVSDTDIHTVIMTDEDNNWSMDGVTYRTNVSKSTSTPAYIGRANGEGANYGVKIYRCTIEDKTTQTVLLDLIPCIRRIDGVVCMYDTMSGRYYTNSGTGNFIPGPTI